MVPGAWRVLACAVLVGSLLDAAEGRSRAADQVSLLQHSSEVQQGLRLRDDTLRITVKDEKGRELHLEARKTTRLGKLMDVVCKRLDLEKEYSRFELRGRQLSQYDTVDDFGIQAGDVIDVTGGRVVAPVREARTSATTAAPGAEAVASVASTTAAPVQITTMAAHAIAPPLPVFQVGDFSYVNISNISDAGTDAANTWAPCSITGKGSQNHTYNIHFIYAPLGLRDTPDVPAQLLRKVDGRRYAEAVQYYREDSEAVGQVVQFVNARQLVEDAKKSKAAFDAAAKAAALEAAEAAARAAAEANATANATGNATENATANATASASSGAKLHANFEAGDFMEISLESNITTPNGNISWVPCRLVGKGQRDHSFQVHFLFGPAGHNDLTNVSEDYLRKIEAREFAEKIKSIKRSAQYAHQAVLQLAEEAANRTKAEEEALAREMEAKAEEERRRKEAEEAAKRERAAALKAAKEKAKKDAEERKAKHDREMARRAEEEKEAKRLAEFAYKDGSAVELKVEKVFKGTQWLPGKVVRKGAEPQSYDVRFDWAPGTNQEIANVPTAFLHPTDAEKYADQVAKFVGDAEQAQGAIAQANKEAARRARALVAERKALANSASSAQPAGAAAAAPPAAPVRAPARPPAAAAPPAVAEYAVGDEVEVKLQTGVKGINWVPATIAAAGTRKHAFDVNFKFTPPKHKPEMKNVLIDFLRKADAEAKQTSQTLSSDPDLADEAVAELEKEALRRVKQMEAARKRRLEKAAAAKR